MRKFIAAAIVAVVAAFAGAQPAAAHHTGKGRTCFSVQLNVWHPLPAGAHAMTIYEGPLVSGGPAGGSYGSGYPMTYYVKGEPRQYQEWHANYGWTQNLVRWYWDRGNPLSGYGDAKVLYQAWGGGVPVVACYYPS